MKRKLLLAAASGAVVLAVLAVAVPVLMKKYLPPEKVRELIVSGARKSLHREVKLGGVSYSLLDGLSLTDLSVSEASDFGAGVFASARALRIQIRWLPLLSRKVVVDSVSADGLKVNVVQKTPGVYNFSDISGAPSSAGGAAAAGAGASFEINIRKTSLTQGEFSYKDRVSGDDWRFSEVDAKVGQFRLNGAFDADLSLKVAGHNAGKPLAAALGYTGKLDLGGQDPRRIRAAFKKLRAEYAGLKLQASGSVENMEAPKLDVSFSLAAQGAAIADGEFKGAVALPRGGAALSAKGDVKLKTSGFAGASLASFGFPKDVVVPALKVSGGFDYAADKASFTGLRVEGSPGSADLNGSVAGLKSGKPAADMDFAAKLDVPALKSADVPWAKLPAGLDLPAASLDAKLHLKGDSAKIAALRVKTKLGSGEISGSVDAMTSGKPAWDLDFAADADLPALKSSDLAFAKLPAGLETPAAAVKAKGHAKGYDVRLDAFHLQNKAGTIDASGTALKLASAKPDFDFDVAAKLDLPEIRGKDYAWAKLPLDLIVPAGSLDGKVHLKGDSAQIAFLKVKTKGGSGEISGSVDAVASAKPSWDLDFAAEAELPALKSSELAWAKLPPGLETPAASLKTKGHAAGYDVSLDSLHVQTKAGTIDVAGSARKLSSAKPDLDLDVAAKLDLPELRSADMPWAKLPPAYVSPAVAVEGKTHFKGDDLDISALHVTAKTGTIDVSGTVKHVTQGPLEPNVSVQAKISLPAFKSVDIPSTAVPAGLQIPASSWDADAQLSLDEAKIRKLRLVVGKNDIEIADGKIGGLRSGNPLFALLVKCRSFDLAELTTFSEATREEKWTGTGFFAVEFAGKWPKPILSGKLKFAGLGGTFAGLKLADFTGIASFDEKQIKAPDVKGKVADGSLTLGLDIKDYATAPKIDVQADLDRFDLGKFMAAKAAMTKEAAPDAKGQPAKPSPPIDASGKLAVGALAHPNVEAKNLEIVWDLTGITPDMKKLGGTAHFAATGGGKFTKLLDMGTQSKFFKVLLFPVMVFTKLGPIGLPDFNNVSFDDLAGDYTFANGLMTVNDGHINSSAGQGVAKGTIDLPAEKLDLLLTAAVAHIKPMDVEVKGTFDKPTSHLKLGKFLSDALVPGVLKKAVQAIPTGTPVDNKQQ